MSIIAPTPLMWTLSVPATRLEELGKLVYKEYDFTEEDPERRALLDTQWKNARKQMNLTSFPRYVSTMGEMPKDGINCTLVAYPVPNRRRWGGMSAQDRWPLICKEVEIWIEEGLGDAHTTAWHQVAMLDDQSFLPKFPLLAMIGESHYSSGRPIMPCLSSRKAGKGMKRALSALWVDFADDAIPPDTHIMLVRNVPAI